jgi:hypothetical protein
MGRCYTSLRLASNQDHDSGASLPKAGAGNSPALPPRLRRAFLAGQRGLERVAIVTCICVRLTALVVSASC